MEELQGFSLGNPWQHPKGARLLPLFPLPSLFFLSPLSSFPFFSLSPTTPEVCHALTPSFQSTKEAKGGINLSHPQVNPHAPFIFLPCCLVPSAQTHSYRATSRPKSQGPKVGQHGPLGSHIYYFYTLPLTLIPYIYIYIYSLLKL